MLTLTTCSITLPDQGASGFEVLLLAADDGHRYYVKRMDDPWIASHPNDVRHLANEYICAKIANRLGLQCPVGELCQFSESLRENLKKDPHQDVIVGPHFGSREISNVGSYGKVEFNLQECQNKESFGLLILFESYVCNSDMHNSNILKGCDQNLWVIDHANAFGGSWVDQPAIDCDEPLKIKDDKFSCARLLLTEIIDVSPKFEEFREKINDGFIDSIVDSTPPEWIDDSRKNAFKGILKCQLKNLENLIAH